MFGGGGGDNLLIVLIYIGFVRNWNFLVLSLLIAMVDYCRGFVFCFKEAAFKQLPLCNSIMCQNVYITWHLIQIVANVEKISA